MQTQYSVPMSSSQISYWLMITCGCIDGDGDFTTTLTSKRASERMALFHFRARRLSVSSFASLLSISIDAILVGHQCQSLGQISSFLVLISIVTLELIPTITVTSFAGLSSTLPMSTITATAIISFLFLVMTVCTLSSNSSTNRC